MSPIMNRRQWLKTSALATTGLLVSSGFPSCGQKEAFSGLSPQKSRIIKLNSNESPYGISEKAGQAIVEAMGECHLYPHGEYVELIELIAEGEGLTPDHIILGGGSTEVFNMIIRWWRAIAGSDEVLETYANHLRCTTFVEMSQLPGHLGAALAVKVNGLENELVVTSLWADLTSAGHFEKGSFDDAVVKPSTQKLLKSFELKVEYFETVVSTGILEEEK